MMQFRICKDYDDLIAVVRERRRASGLTCLQFDAKVGLPDGYTSKIECGDRALGWLSLDLVLKALGLSIIAITPDPGDPPDWLTPQAQRRPTAPLPGQLVLPLPPTKQLSRNKRRVASAGARRAARTRKDAK